ncbi:flagellar protein FlgN [Lachnospiraceae bacterium C1.1]|nr:flagellar protein FlgN [Lachnospiraceae bacterium C1.1]
MASLMENLISTLNKEADKYTELLRLSKKKTPIIVRGDIAELQKITDEEQDAVEVLSALDKERSTIMEDIANVTNKDVGELKLKNLIVMMEKRPKEHDALVDVRDRLDKAVNELKLINSQNAVLIKQSLDMIDFNLALERSIRTGPETGNYNRAAENAGSMLVSEQGGFDARQ